VSEILGIPVLDIPANYTPLGVYAIVECLNDEGGHVYLTRHANMSALARVGALAVLNDLEMADWHATFEPLEDGE
jgi:hypothetical protein